MLQRAYAILDIKGYKEDDKRKFSGIASTPSVDRMGDIVEPKGATFKLPIPLLWQHDASNPIGWVTSAQVTPAGIEVEGEVANVKGSSKLSERLDEYWEMMKSKLVRGLSIGFQPMESERLKDGYGMRYVKWAWHELSAVTIPANAEANIMAIKSADKAIMRSASGLRPVVRLSTAKADLLPGDSGTVRRKGVVYLKS